MNRSQPGDNADCPAGTDHRHGRRLAPQPQAHQAGQTGQQQGRHGEGSGLGLARGQIERAGTHRRSKADAQSNRGFVDAAVLALRLAHVHRVEERGVVEQARGQSKDNLRQHQHQHRAPHQEADVSENQGDEGGQILRLSPARGCAADPALLGQLIGSRLGLPTAAITALKLVPAICNRRVAGG